jgi:hypothetical protein
VRYGKRETDTEDPIHLHRYYIKKTAVNADVSINVFVLDNAVEFH